MGHPIRIPNQRVKRETYVQDRDGNRIQLAKGLFVKYIARRNLPHGHNFGEFNENYRKAIYVDRKIGIVLIDVDDLEMDAC